jgi:16S rRNA (uracil1498-N3)-methyltransferase
MRISRIHTPQDLEPGVSCVLDAKPAHYLVHVLRLRAGDSVVLFNGDGFDYAAEITVASRAACELRVNTRLPAAPESRCHITLVQAISRGDRMDTSLQKSTELGVFEIQPVVTHRVEVKLSGERLEKRMAHWRGVIVAACEQSGRAVVPRLHEPLDLDAWLARPGERLRLALEAGGAQSLAGLTPVTHGVELLVGPEGGFEAGELLQMEQAGVRPVSLGPRVLRTETAGPAAIAVLQAICGDF